MLVKYDHANPKTFITGTTSVASAAKQPHLAVHTPYTPQGLSSAKQPHLAVYVETGLYLAVHTPYTPQGLSAVETGLF